MKNLNERVKILRKQLGFSQEEFAAKLGVTKQAISNMETSKSTPSPMVLFNMHVNMDVNLNYIIAGTGDIFITEKGNKALKASLLKEFEQMLKSRGIE
ncbi:MAG: helix-turn-helix transcriptional regulator [Candidatus Gastranaerophilales bacterium]|nr:helix-turn-helix transcriptional regulator [Candidatus Gastranaerophilales bacterium]